MYQKAPVITQIAEGIYAINCYQMSSPFLIIGDERAFLIDTGTGNYDLLSLIREAHLTDLPIEVALTHVHGDHVGGIIQFDTCYVAEKEIPMLSQFDTHYMQLFCDFYLDLLREEDGTIGIFKDFPTKVLPWEGHMPKIVALHDGDTIDLGNRLIKVYENPTHTKQDMSFLDTKTRLLFTGDAIGTNVGQFNSPINHPTYVLSMEEILKGLLNIWGHRSEFDGILPGHPNDKGENPILSPGVIDKLIAIAQDVLAGSIPITTYYNLSDGVRSYAEKDGVRLYFFKGYLWEKDMDLIRK